MSEFIDKFQTVGLVGYGSIGKRYSEILKKLGVKVNIFSVGKSLIYDQKNSAQYKFYFNENEFWSSGIKAIFICNPSFMHFEWIKKSLSRDIPTFCEKPVCTSRKELDELTNLIQHKSSITTSSGYMWKYEYGVNYLKKILNSINKSEVVKISLFMSTYLPDWHPWEDYKNSYASNTNMGGGLTLTCSHEIDTLRYLVGDLKFVGGIKKSISSLSTDTDDFISVLFTNLDEICIQLDMNWYQKRKERVISIQTEKSEILWDYEKSLL